VRFGWRWVPGVPFVYESKVGRSTSSGVVVRAEAWSYTPLTLDPSGLLTVHGELVGFGASVVEDGQALPESTLRDAREIARDRTPTDVDLGLRLNGRLVSCSQTDFAEALPHRVAVIAGLARRRQQGALHHGPEARAAGLDHVVHRACRVMARGA
jgi:hypothetical protein